MKKRIVNVLLSVAVVTTMMFTVTACGSKDDGKGAEPATVENTVSDAEPASEAKDEPASEAKDEPAENADAAGGMSVSDWVNSDEASTYTSVFNTMFDGAMTATFEADGNTLSMVFTLSEETLGTDGSDLTDEQKEAAQTMMQEQYNASKGEFEPMRDELKKSIGVSDLVVRIVYKTSNGTELFSQDL